MHREPRTAQGKFAVGETDLSKKGEAKGKFAVGKTDLMRREQAMVQIGTGPTVICNYNDVKD